MLSCMNVFAAQDLKGTEQERITVERELNIELLKKLDILTEELPDGGEITDKFVTRGEFAEIAVRMLNFEKSADKYDASKNFTDVTEKRGWAVDMAADMGIVSGYDYGLYLPDKEISVDEACKILVCVLGYRTPASLYGGWYDGYNQMSGSLKLLKGTDFSGTDKLSWENCVIVLNNTLNTNILSQGSSLDKLEEKETLLKSVFSVEYDSGIVSETKDASLSKSDGSGSGEITVIGDRTLNSGDTDINDYLGFNVKYYYRTDSGDDTLILCRPIKNRVKTIKTCDLISFSDGIYTYYEGSSKKDAVLAKGYDFIYNGRLYASGYDKELYIPKSGYVKLIDNNNDGKFDVIFSWDFISRIVKNINVSDEYISFDYEGSGIHSIDVKNSDVKVYTSDGNETELSAIKAGNAIFAAVSGKDGEQDRLYTIYVSAKTLIGEVVSKSADKIAVKTDDGTAEYNIDPNNENRYKLDKLKTGAEETFYINLNGEIFACAGSVDSSMKTAFLISAYVSEDNEKLFLKILTTGNEFANLECRKNFTLSGAYDSKYPSKRTNVSIKSAQIGHNILARGVNMINDVIRYKLDENGKVTVVETAVPCKGTDADGNPDMTGDGFHYILKDFKELMYSSHSNAFMPALRLKKMNDLILLDSDRTFFTVPEKYDDTVSLKSQYAATGYLQNDRSQKVKLFATSGQSKAADIIVRAGDAKGSPSDTSVVYGVMGVPEVLNSNDEVVWQINAVNKGARVSYQTDDKDILNGVGKGDLIRVSTDAGGGIGNLERVVAFDSKTKSVKLALKSAYADGSGFNAADNPAVTDEAGLGKIRKFMFGAAYENYNGRLIICLEKELGTAKTSVEAINLKAFSNIQVFDGEEWKTGSAADIYDYKTTGRHSMIFARLNYANAGELYVYNTDN